MNPDDITPVDPYELADELGVDIGPRPLSLAPDAGVDISDIAGLGEALDRLMDSEPCPICDGPLVMAIPAGSGRAYTQVMHDEDCPAA